MLSSISYRTLRSTLGKLSTKPRYGLSSSSRSLFFGANPRIRPFSAESGEESLDVPPGMEAKELYALRNSLPVSFADISRAYVAIKNGIKRTSFDKSYFLSELIGK